MLRLAVITALIFGFGGLMTYRKISTNGRYNDQLDHLFLKYGEAMKVPPEFLKALAMNESGTRFQYSDVFEPKGGTVGVMHIKLSTARDYEPDLTKEDLLLPENEIRVAAKFVADLWKQFNGDRVKVAWAYNAGASRVVAGILPSSTAEYLERFERNYNRVTGVLS